MAQNISLGGDLLTIQGEGCDGKDELEESDDGVDKEASEATVGGGSGLFPSHGDA